MNKNSAHGHSENNTLRVGFTLTNAVMSVFSLFFLVRIFPTPPQTPIPSVVKEFDVFTHLVMIAYIVLYYLSHTFYLAQSKKIITNQSFLIHAILTVFPIGLFVIWFTGYFFASTTEFPLLIIILSMIFLSILRRPRKLLLFLASMILLFTLGTIMSNFEEDFCLKQGDKAKMKGPEFLIATQDDVDQLKTYGITVGQKITPHFYTHMTCHRSFDFWKAVKENYGIQYF